MRRAKLVGAWTATEWIDSVASMKAKQAITKSWRNPMREQLSQRKRGANRPFILRLSNGRRVRVSDPMSMAITSRTVFVVRRTGRIEQFGLKEVASMVELKRSRSGS